MFDNKYNLIEELVNYLNFKKIKNLTNVQEATLRNKTKNIFVESPTGTGKTLSFLLPIFNKLDFQPGIKSIIFVPTRELGNQIFNVIKEINKFINFTYAKFFGGEDINKQLLKIENSPNIIVATPQRLKKILEQKKVSFTKLKYVIVDEVDMIFDFGMLEDIKLFLDKNIKDVNYNFNLFSATFPIEVQNYIKKLFKKEIVNVIIKNYDLNLKVNFFVSQNKKDYLLKLINDEKFNPYFCLIFSKSNEEVKSLYDFLVKNNTKKIMYFSSEMSQRERKRVMKLIANEKIVFLVTTDLISRGMDFSYVSHVINYSLPIDLNYYIHRIGRTNRNNLNGTIFDLLDESEIDKYKKIRKRNKNISFIKTKLF